MIESSKKSSKKSPAKLKKSPTQGIKPMSKKSPAKRIKKAAVPLVIEKQSTPVNSSINVNFKHAQSPNPNEILYRLRTFLGWSAFVALSFAGLSMLSQYSSPGKTALDPNQLQASVIQSSKNASEVFSLAQEGDITLTAVGDILLARFIEQKMRKTGDYTYPFANVKDFLGMTDLTFGNLETPFFPGKTTPNESTTFRADPESIAGLTTSGFDLVSIANNHTMNYRVPGLTKTLEVLRAANIKAVGGAENKAAAHTPVIVEVKNKKIAFLAYNDPNIAPRYHGEATDVQPGIAKMEIDQVQKDITAAKSLDADIIIVSMHAGIEYRKEPTQFQKDFAHAAVDAGASVVIGHHPHIVQEVERYGKGIIMYSLGNFVFDQLFSEDVKTGLLARIIFTADGLVSADFFPTYNDKLQPRILEGKDRIDTLHKMGIPEIL